MLLLGSIDFLPQNTFTNAGQPLGTDQIEPILKRISVSRFAINELLVGNIRREDKFRLLCKGSALAVATGAA